MIKSAYSFEPRIGTAQFVFGIVYSLITLTALAMALYEYTQGNTEPYMQYFMALVFAIMAGKSFYIHKRVKNLLKNGQQTVGTLISCEPVRGITILRASVDVKDFGLIEIESRLAGETVAHEIKRYLNDNATDKVPVLVVGDKKHPKGMIMIRTHAGHLDLESIKTKESNKELNK